jgi:soluble lytic murein transglycosylase-like protein
MEIRYYARLLRSVLGIKPVGEWRTRAAVAFPGAILAVGLLLTAFGAPGVIGSDAGLKNRTPIDLMLARANEAEYALGKVEKVYASEVEPLARVIMTYRNDERLANRVATALVKESRRAGLSPDILLAVLLVENPWINPSARSPVGARGLMQVMPGHRGKWKACPQSLDEIESNICYGAQIFRQYMRDNNGHVETALLRYNGCVKSTNTPNCHLYPSLVLAKANRATQLARQQTRTVAD